MLREITEQFSRLEEKAIWAIPKPLGILHDMTAPPTAQLPMFSS